MKSKSNLIKNITFQIGLIFSIILILTAPVEYANAADDAVLGVFITFRGEVVCSDTGKAPEQTKISVFDANSNNALVKEVIIHGGTYELNLDPGVYRIYFSTEGYSTFISDIISINRETLMRFADIRYCLSGKKKILSYKDRYWNIRSIYDTGQLRYEDACAIGNALQLIELLLGKKGVSG